MTDGIEFSSMTIERFAAFNIFVKYDIIKGCYFI